MAEPTRLGDGPDTVAMEGELRRVLGHYDLGELVTTRLVERGFVNENWILKTTRGRYFLKHRHPDVCDPTVIGAQHLLAGHLQRAGFPAPAIIPTVNGATLLVLDDQFYEIQEYVEGTPCDRDRPAHFREAAMMLGRYHTLARDFPPEALLKRDELYSPAGLGANLANLTVGWRPEWTPTPEPLFRQLKSHAVDLALRFADHGDLPTVVIHGDYYAGNLLFRDDRVVGVVDYDKARWQARVAELAEALIFFASPQPGRLKFCVYPGFLRWEPFGRFLHHYSQATILDEIEVRAIPDYIRSIWLCVSLQLVAEKESRRAEARRALGEALVLANWAAKNAHQMIEAGREAIGGRWAAPGPSLAVTAVGGERRTPPKEHQ